MRRIIWFLLSILLVMASFGMCCRASASHAGPPAPAPRPAADKPDTGIVFLPFDKAPELVQTVSPVYPEEARKSHVQAVVMLSLVVDKKGAPRDVVAIEPTKLEGRAVKRMSKPKLAKFRDMFAKSAVEAARKWQFAPAKTLEGKPVAAKVRVPVGFKITTETLEAGIGGSASPKTPSNAPSIGSLPAKHLP
jgi:hypothetical protein